MTLKNKRRDGCLVVFLEGDIDLHQVDDFRDQLMELLTAEPANKVILNCRQVNRMDSSGVGLFIFLRTRFKDKAVLRICELPERVLELFRMTQLESFFDMDVTEEESLKALQNP